MAAPAADQAALDFDAVFAEELAHLSDTEDDSDHAQAAEELKQNLIGLAFSGGGIRSASFNLGMLQALAKHQVLPQVDYLSTVSGGGYIGGWVSSWLSRAEQTEKAHRAQTTLSEHRVRVRPWRAAATRVFNSLAGRDLRGGDSAPVAHLRRFSNYLTPKLGLLSADFWTAIATHFRNTLLNLCILLPALALMTGLPWLVLAASDALYHGASAGWLAALALALLTKGWWDFLHQQHSPTWRDGQLALRIGVFVIAPAWLTAVALRAASHDARSLPGVAQLPSLLQADFFVWSLVGSVILGGLVSTIRAVERLRLRLSAQRLQVVEKRSASLLRWSLSAFVSGALLGFMLWGVRDVLQQSLPAELLPRVTGLGTVLVFTSAVLAVVLQIGLLGNELPESSREWWARAGAWCWLLGMAWLAAFAIAFIAPPLLVRAGAAFNSSLGAGWLSVSIIGALLGRSSWTGGPGSSRWLERAIAAAPYLFVLGILVATALLNYVVILKQGSVCSWSDSVCNLVGDPALGTWFTSDWTNGRGLPAVTVTLGWLFVGYALFLYAMSKRIDINVFSFHAFYANRLTRCFLGATRLDRRRPNSLSGFDFNDDLGLGRLPRRPYHLINTALNLTLTQNLAWQERMAASFTFSKLHSGYQLPGGKGCYQPTRTFGNSDPSYTREMLKLGTAITISGAAASPNAGYHTSPVMAFLMTIFNVRLGYWLANPRDARSWKLGNPLHAGKLLLAELFGRAGAESNFVYLSDGGHFENLGIYELVRRRCRFIIACDAGCDPTFSFEDLGNAIRKCRIDLGIEIDLRVSSIQPDPSTGLSKAHCVVGQILYRNQDINTPNGYLLYIKSSMTGDESEDIKQYRASHAAFPHESTGDQWFSESQFESYRKLGYEIGDAIFKEAKRIRSREDVEEVFLQIRNYWLPSSPVNSESFSYHSDTLQQIMRDIKEDTRLAFLDVQVVPEWPYLMSTQPTQETRPALLWLPKDDDLVRAGFYACNRMLQLMENVYMDLQLEDYYDHPDNRGWMNLFRHWSWSGMFRATWAIQVSIYGARFQEFCRKQLALDFEPMRITPVLDYPPPEPTRVTDQEKPHLQLCIEQCKTLNFVEHAKIYDAACKLTRNGVNYSALRVLRVDLSVGIKQIPAASLEFPIAYLLMYRDTLDAWRVADFRVRDHLRGMGLARRALQAIVAEYPEIQAPDEVLLETLYDERGKRFARDFGAIFKAPA